MNSLKIASIFIVAVFSMSFMISGASAAKIDSNWQYHIKIVELNDTFTAAPSGIHIQKYPSMHSTIRTIST